MQHPHEITHNVNKTKDVCTGTRFGCTKKLTWW